MPPRRLSSADPDAAIERVAPNVLALRCRRMTGEEALRRAFRFPLKLADRDAG